MELRTDDDIHQARMVYLGPEGWTLPFHLTYAQYGVGAALTVVACAVLRLVVGSWEASAFGVAVGIVGTSLIFRFVDPDRPARAVLRTVVTDHRRITPAATDGQPLPRRTFTGQVGRK